MSVMSREQKLVNMIDSDEQSLPTWIHSIVYERDKVPIGNMLSFLNNYSRKKAMYAWFVEGDIKAFKNNCYVASKLSLASVGRKGGSTFELSGDILYALLSDNPRVIESMAAVETPQLLEERDDPKNMRARFYMFQLAIRGDDRKLEEMISKVSRKGKRHARDEAQSGEDFFSLLLARDQGKLEELIQEKHARTKNHDRITDGFMAYLGTVEAKLCWYRKIPVEIESPMIPMQLMPVTPLDAYDEIYDFLKAGWIPPRQGLIGKITRWFS